MLEKLNLEPTKHTVLEDLQAIVTGTLAVAMGVLLILFRHQASLGGLNVLVLFIQERYGIRAGKLQMVLDTLIVIAGLWLVTPWSLAASILGAIVLNFVLTTNHKPGRYTGF